MHSYMTIIQDDTLNIHGTARSKSPKFSPSPEIPINDVVIRRRYRSVPVQAVQSPVGVVVDLGDTVLRWESNTRLGI